ncbi:MAG: hypothetical protein ABIP90_05535 [Vicinamibacterales bacterium]
MSGDSISAVVRAALLRLFTCFVMAAVCSTVVRAQRTSATTTPASFAAPPSSFVVESYYRVRWGDEDEFIALFHKNHVPFLRRQLEKGVLLEVRLDTPREHMPEDARWDLRMTLVYRDAAVAYQDEKITEADYSTIIKDDAAEEVFKREERRRFSLLLAHWDVNVKRGAPITVR